MNTCSNGQYIDMKIIRTNKLSSKLLMATTCIRTFVPAQAPQYKSATKAA